MAQVFYLRCRHCGEPMKKNPWPYCPPCNIALCYKAMPLLLGMMMTAQKAPSSATVPVTIAHSAEHSRWRRYPHLRHIMD